MLTPNGAASRPGATSERRTWTVVALNRVTDGTKGYSNRMDRYTLRARVVPASLVIFPFVLGLVLANPDAGDALRVVAVLVLAGGPAYLVASAISDAGRALEKKLYAEWGGKPTTQALRLTPCDSKVAPIWSDTDWIHKNRSNVEQLLGANLPSSEEEAEKDRQEQVNNAYDRAVAEVRGRTRNRQRFYLLHTANLDFGFRRNTLALKKWGVVAAITTLVMLAMYWIVEPLPRSLTGWFVQIVATLGVLAYAYFWFGIVRKEWVKHAAKTYAEQLFEAVAGLVQEPREPEQGDQKRQVELRKAGKRHPL